MAEEKQDYSSAPTMDDLSVLRLLLHSIKGISGVSASAMPMMSDEQDDSRL